MHLSVRAGMLFVLVFAITVPEVASAQTPDSALAINAAGQRLFRINVDAGALFGGQYDGGTSSGGIAAEGAGTRMMWYPQKAAFRAGHVTGTQWDDFNIGYFTTAIGNNVRASGNGGTAFGVRSTASGSSTFAVGEDNIASGAASVAMGSHAHTNARQGSFVFGDRSTGDTIRAGVNHSANWRVSGGFRVFTSSNLSTGVTFQSGASVSNWGQANAVISTSTGAYLHTNGTWQNVSDVDRKHRFSDVSPETVLEQLRGLPIQEWSYRVEAEDVRHIGPTAQDFSAAFGLGNDERTISAVDGVGVALIGVQALDRRTSEHGDRVGQLERENVLLRQELHRLLQARDSTEARLARLEAILADSRRNEPRIP